MAYEKANRKSGRLFVTDKGKLEENPKLPALNGTIEIDGIVLHLALWRRKSKSGSDYFTAEMTYPNDETARLHADGEATSAAAKKEREWDAAHPKTGADQERKWKARPVNSAPAATAEVADDDLPF